MVNSFANADLCGGPGIFFDCIGLNKSVVSRRAAEQGLPGNFILPTEPLETGGRLQARSEWDVGRQGFARWALEGTWVWRSLPCAASYA